MDPQFLAIARDPQIIPGVHHYCNEWCDYCGVTARCCGYRCTELYRKRRGRKDGEPTFRTINEAVEFTREMSAAEGVRTDELDALLGSRRAHRASTPTTRLRSSPGSTPNASRC